MRQTFQLVAPRAKLALWWGKLGEVLFDGSASDLVRLLAVPVRPQHGPSQSVPVTSTATVYEAKRGAKRSRDNNDVHTESSRCCKQIKVQGRDEKVVPDAVVTLSSLPPELHRLIFSFIDDSTDVVSFSITNQYFLSIGLTRLKDYYMSFFGQWAGTNIVCVGEDVEPNDYPPGLFSAQELEALRQTTISDEDYSDEEETPPSEPFTLYHFTHPSVSTEEVCRSFVEVGLQLVGSCSLRGITKDPAFHHIVVPHLVPKEEIYFPKDQQWILRNLTTKEIVHSNAIALSPDYISGPDIHVLGFGEVIMSRISWSSSSWVSMNDPTNISRGVWAGHCFDITTLSRHEAETRGEEWRDISDEVGREIASIWEGEYGADWREILRKKH